jgi:oligopeptide transport system substrate-binding protein
VLLLAATIVLGGCGSQPLGLQSVAEQSARSRTLAQDATATPSTGTVNPGAFEERTPDGRRVLTATPGELLPPGSGPQILTLTGSALGPTTLDPALIRDAEGAFLARQVFRGLVSIAPDMTVVPELAERIEISADGQTYTFTLRANARFHDGKPIDADAVVRALNRSADPALAAGDGTALPAAMYLIDIDGAAERLAGQADQISGLRVVDRQTLEIRLRAPAIPFLFKLAGTSAMVVDTSTTGNDLWWTEPNGSGPFELAELSESRILLRGFDDFYGGAPRLEEVRILQGSAVSQPLNLYESGRIDVTETPFYALDRVLSPHDPLFDELVVVPQLSTSFVLLSPNHAPFDDINLRLAIAHAVDRVKYVRVGMDDKVVLAEGIVPPGMLGQEWSAVNPAYDLDAARSLLVASGELPLTPTIFGGMATTLKLAIERDLGMSIDVIVPEWPLFTQRLTERTLPAFALTWIADYPDPSNFLDSMFRSDSPDNYIGYRNAQVDRLLDEAATEQDEELRVELYRQAQQLVIDDGVLIPLFHDVAHTLIKPYVNGLVVSPAGILGLERVWIER